MGSSFFILRFAIWIFLVFFCCTGSKAQFPAHVDSVYTFIKYNSVWRNTIKDWEPVDEAFKKDIASAKTIKDTMNCFVSVLKKLNDVHSQLYLNNQFYGHYNPVDDSTGAALQPVITKARNENGLIKTRMLENKIVYIKVPGINAFSKEDVNKYAQALYDSVYQYYSQKPKGFIIDLRLNTGGNLYPMLAGLSTLLDDTVLAYETDMEGAIVRKWELNKGNFVIGGYQTTTIKQPHTAIFEKIPVAVLTGPVTISSGSMTAIAFKHRPNTIFIGEPTGDGYTTSNGYFSFASNLYFLFATNFVADRNKTIYKTVVPVDITVNGGDNFDDMTKDEKIKAAIQWLKKKK